MKGYKNGIIHTVIKNVFCKHCSISTRTCTPKTAGIVVIGDEILKGDIIDTNSAFMTRELYKLGVKLKKISVVGDLEKDISEEVETFSSHYDYVITSGGIGPTHDDITYQAVAKAFNEPLILNQDLKKLCNEFFKTSELNPLGMKLAWIPQSAKLNYAPSLKFPCVSVRNVFIFPGVPELCQRAFYVLSSKLFISNMKFFKKYVYFNIPESEILSALDAVVKEYPNVQFGSYPKLNHNEYKVKITIESTDENTANKAYNRLIEIVPDEIIVKKCS